MRIEDITTKNSSIAKFVSNGINMYAGYEKTYVDSFMFNIGYNNDWDKLMLVVRKIESKGYVFIICDNYCYIQDKKSFKTHVETEKHPVFYAEYCEHDKARAVYTTVYKFTKWYNETN